MRIFFSFPLIGRMRGGFSFGLNDLKVAQRAQQGKRFDGGFVYVIKHNDNDPDTTVKVGVTNDPDRRLLELSMASPYRLEYFFIGACDGPGFDIENAAHNLLSQHNTNGDWFSVAPELAVAAVMGSAAKLGHNVKAVTPQLARQIVAIGPNPEARKPRRNWLQDASYFLVKSLFKIAVSVAAIGFFSFVMIIVLILTGVIK